MSTTDAVKEYDIVICGGGLAGLTLARQLTMQMPHLSLLVIEGTGAKKQTSALNVGESTIEISAHYLADILELRSYLEVAQLPKMGLRFFFGSGKEAFHTRPEFGTSQPSAIASFQLDRGLLEADLRVLNKNMGIAIIDHGKVEDIHLCVDAQYHEVVFSGPVPAQKQRIRCCWVIDAMGRRRFLQKKLHVAEAKDRLYSAAWFRMPGRIDVQDLVSAAEPDWHLRVAAKKRYYSTNHLMDNGRWVWLIPLSSDSTSIGIVTHEDFFPFHEYNTYEKASSWLQKYEPALHALIGASHPIDFQCLRQYSYSAQQVFSDQRWACTGDAAVFADPFISPGIDQIGFANTIITEMIRRDSEEKLTTTHVDIFNRNFLGFNDITSWIIHNGYPFFGNATVMGAKLVWDFARGFSINGPQRFNMIYLDEQKMHALQPFLAQVFALTARMERLFKQWSTLSQQRCSFQFLDYFAVPGMQETYLRNLQPHKTLSELITDHQATLDYLEELAQMIFLVALVDTMPNLLSTLPSPLWLNTSGIGLDSTCWERERLFAPFSTPRPLPLGSFFSLFGIDKETLLQIVSLT
jgi:flavin-dependent dehydrogenase